MFSRIFQKTVVVEETSFAKFFRTASSAEKKRTYAKVLERATERQVRVLEQAASLERATTASKQTFAANKF